ncbi:hypothetical protein IG631_21241 [Alternaria alternata]|nr:hypothetical protein IG631_21241 [Alternaria alternata]
MVHKVNCRVSECPPQCRPPTTVRASASIVRLSCATVGPIDTHATPDIRQQAPVRRYDS